MRKILIAGTLLLVALALTRCGSQPLQAQEGVRGSGRVTSQSRTVGAFTALSFHGGGKLFVERTGTESLTITADDNLMPYLQAEVRDGRLELGQKGGTSLQGVTDLTYRLTVKDLNDVQIAGAVNADFKNLQTEALKVELAGGASTTLSGSAGVQDVTLNGAARYQAENLASRKATITGQGASVSVVRVSDELAVNMTGVGSVEYIGDPVVKSSGGTVRKH